jgi:hypothetical protein
MTKDMMNKLLFLKQILGYDIFEQLDKDIAKTKFDALNNEEFEAVKRDTKTNLLRAIENPDSYQISDYQRDRRSKIQTVYDIIIGQYFEDCIMSLIKTVGKTSIYLNYERNSGKKSNSEEDFIVHGKLKTYLVEFKTLSFKAYKDLPIKEMNIKDKSDETLILLLNKDTYDLYVLPVGKLKEKPYEIFAKWNKSCIMIKKSELTEYNSFNTNDPKAIQDICQKIFK